MLKWNEETQEYAKWIRPWHSFRVNYQLDSGQRDEQPEEHGPENKPENEPDQAPDLGEEETRRTTRVTTEFDWKCEFRYHR